MIITINIPKRSKVTNGEIIKSLFPDGYEEPFNETNCMVYVFNDAKMLFSYDWWSKPYMLPKKEEED